MKALLTCYDGRSRALPPLPSLACRLSAWALALVSTCSLLAAPEVRTLTGGPAQFSPDNPAGYVDGVTASGAQFHTPFGLALDPAGTTLFLADRDNNAIRQLDLVLGQTFTFATAQIDQPVGVAVDSAGRVYVLNRGNGNNGTVLSFDAPARGGDFLATKAVNLVNAAGIALDPVTNIYVTVQGNTVIRITPDGVTSTVATINSAGVSLQGLVVKRDGRLAVCDGGRHGIYLINPNTGAVTTFAGFHGVGDFTTPYNVASSASAQFNQPYGVAETGDGALLVADSGNHRVKVVLTTGVVTNLYGVSSNFWVQGSASQNVYPGWWDGTVAVPDTLGTVEARSPVGVLFAPNGTVYTTETYYHLIRVVTGTGLALPPPPPLPVPPPRLGWVNFTTPPSIIVSVLQTGPSTNFNTFTFNNDRTVAIEGIEGTETHYTAGPTSAVADTVPNPTPSSGSTPPVYHDGLFPDQVPPSIIQPQPDVTVKAISFESGRPSSSIIQARFIFKAASPQIFGDNAAQFKVECETVGATMWYTTDGSDPTNAPPSVGPLTSPWNISLNITTNTEFKIRAFRDNYQPSEIATRVFSPTNFSANKITFGFANGEASSAFIASAGQYFYAPVTLSTLADTKIYSLQFNVTVTNIAAAPPVAPGDFGFRSMLVKPIAGSTLYLIPGTSIVTSSPTSVINGNEVANDAIPGTTQYEPIPPLAFSQYFTNPPPGSAIVYYDGLPFINMMFTNTTENLLGVGWLERYRFFNLYDTVIQDLIQYSQAHDTLFKQEGLRIIVGGYAVHIPATAQAGQNYEIRLGRPSATSDGIGTPGSDVYIATPTNGSYGPGVINAIKRITVGQAKYVAGDSAPFRWFNAGDFGNATLDNSDVMQVFQSAIYAVDMPPPGSDFFDAMDSCGGTYTVSPNGYLVLGSNIAGNTTLLNGLFNGNDTNINQIAFGDGVLDVSDLYVTFRRSLDPGLVNFRRFWTNGVRAAEIIAPGSPLQPLTLAPINASAAVKFSSQDTLAAPGQTLQIPIKARVTGSYPIRILALNLSVTPLDRSPTITAPLQFTPNPALGEPTLTTSIGSANYAAAWLNNNIPGLTGDTILGTLTVQIPANAGSSAAYAVHFDHASASPNGLASFPRQTETDLITGSDRSASSWNDGIPDSWRLRYFGSLSNQLSAATADADGDGVNNMQEYLAGTDPNDSASALRASATQTPFTIRWPSVDGKHYVVERSTTLFDGSWSPVATQDGTGVELQFQDGNATADLHYFYRVRVE